MRLTLRQSPTVVGAACASLGIALLFVRGLAWAALGVELVALAFGAWARALPDAADQMARWAWLRRPALALWLGAAIRVVLPDASEAITGAAGALGGASLTVAPPPLAHAPMLLLRTVGALAVLWSGLELMAALPTSRPFPDLTGPMPRVGPWLTALLPVTGFMVLWRQAPMWTGAPFVSEVATLALMLAALLAVLRAYARRSLTATLRWLVVYDSALASMLVARGVVPGEVAAVLWLGAAGGRLIALAAELRGQAVRRGPALTRLWRLAGWVAGTALSWPLLCDAVFGGHRFHLMEAVVLAPPVYLASVIWLRRVVEAPERRTTARPEDRGPHLSRVGAWTTLCAGPVALAWTWWQGFEVSFPGAALALVPPLLAWWPVRRLTAALADAPETTEAVPGGSRDFALNAFRGVTYVERQFAEAIGAVARALGAPARDLHTGDAQEYLLFLVGVAVLALLLPLIR